jgi:hypothetical protein
MSTTINNISVSFKENIDNSVQDVFLKSPKLLAWINTLDSVSNVYINNINWYDNKVEELKLDNFSVLVDGKSYLVRGSVASLFITIHVPDFDKKYYLLSTSKKLTGITNVELISGTINNLGALFGEKFTLLHKLLEIPIPNTMLLTDEPIEIDIDPSYCDTKSFIFNWHLTMTDYEFEELNKRVYNVDDTNIFRGKFKIYSDEMLLSAFKNVQSDSKTEIAYYRSENANKPIVKETGYMNFIYFSFLLYILVNFLGTFKI